MSADPTTVFVLRVTSGILAVLAIGVAVFRFVYMHSTGYGSVQEALGLLFPLSMGVFCAYLAIKGKMPFSTDQDKR